MLSNLCGRFVDTVSKANKRNRESIVDSQLLFNLADTNGDGLLSTDELSNHLSDLGVPAEELDRLLLSLDTNGDGQVKPSSSATSDCTLTRTCRTSLRARSGEWICGLRALYTLWGFTDAPKVCEGVTFHCLKNHHATTTHRE